jgi:type II secretory pathway pseudopilin PulG
LLNYDNNFKNLRGFTYLGILFFVAFIGVGLAAAGTFWSVAAQRSNENELLYIGHSVRNAIRSYYLHGPAGIHQYPSSLEQLIQDNRTGILQRHLRRIPIDPMTKSTHWNLITIAEGAIIGVSSMSQKRPIKRGNFAPEDEGLTDAECYCDWRFVYLPVLQEQ